ncbi:MAG: F0F1 ATP synthase subunit B [Bacteroidota bacterium]|nr:F0F1 ATP synthase subunit B [Bacteroidota bacterium]
METLLRIEPGMIIWTLLTFGLLLYLLKKFAWKPLLGALESREERIRSDLVRTKHAREEAEKLAAERRGQLQAAELEARRIIDEARKTAENLQKEILRQADEKAQARITQALAEIRREKETAFAQLKAQVADFAIAAASRILREEVDSDRNRQLVDEFIARLPRN